IFQKSKDDLEREYYIQMTKKFGWTSRLLANQIEGNSYKNFLLNQTNFDNTLVEKYKNQAMLAVKDEYNFDFLDLGDKYNEKELELGLISKVREFLTQMGADFTFVGNQYKLKVDDDEYFIDLLLYHRKLKSLIAVELKIGKFRPEYAGKMNFYLSVLNDTIKLPDENPSIGIIICKDKKRATVEYALKDSTQPIGIATYKLSNTLPANMKKYLPTPQEINEKLLIFVDDMSNKVGEKTGKREAERVAKRVGNKLTKNQTKITRNISKDNHITIKELSKKVGIAEKNIEKNIAKLKLLGIIKRIGSARGGHWEVLIK
ncbi:DUF1016 family protein, partial [bacterium]|nr:DUF1016 family protein [bacterium]